MVGPNVWNICRLLVFVLGMTLMTALMLPRARDIRQTVVHAGLAAMPAFTVLAVPKFARDFAWFGPQEPLLLGGLALGGSLIWVAVSALATDAPVRRLATGACAVAGAVFWLVGVYQKEVALSAIPLLAAALYVGRARLACWKSLSPARRYALAALGAVLILPLVHVAIQIAWIAMRGDLVYEAEGGVGIWVGLEVLYDWAHEAMPQTARDLLVVTLALVAVASVVRRRIDPLAVGSLGSGIATIVFAAQSGVAVSRYYIPLLALFAVAASLSLARLPDLVAVGAILVIFFAFMPATDTRAEVRRWSAEEQEHSEIVALLSDLELSRCTVAVEGLDLETSIALRTLVARRSAQTRTCAEAYLVLPEYPAEDLELLRTCEPGELDPLIVGRLAAVHACSRLQVGAERLLEAHRFHPSSL